MYRCVRVGSSDSSYRNCGSSSDPAKGGFQRYVIVPKVAVAELPYSIPSSKGVVLPLGISTAAAGLFQRGYLALPFPKDEFEDLGRSVLIWGGSSSVGSCAIQLAVAAGADVVTTASPGNFEYVKRLGARQCFDYHDDDIEDKIVEALKGRTVAGAYHAVGGDGAVQSCAKIVDRAKGKAIVVTVRGVPGDGIPSSVRTKMSESRLLLSVNVGHVANQLGCSRCKQHFRRGQRGWSLHLAGLLAESAR